MKDHQPNTRNSQQPDSQKPDSQKPDSQKPDSQKPDSQKPDAASHNIAAAKALSSPCRLCEIRCGVDRLAGERGRCGLADSTPVYRVMTSYGEEAALSPSLLVNLSGCSMRCTFCSEDEHLRPPFSGRAIAPDRLASVIAAKIRAEQRTPKNINFVGGEPSISLPFLLETIACLDQMGLHTPRLLNTNGALTPEAIELCRGVFDIYVVDLKFGARRCAETIGKFTLPPNHPRRRDSQLGPALDLSAIVRRTIETFAGFEGSMLYVRHLLMPGHLDCCTLPVIDWLARRDSVVRATVNLMSGFVPFLGTRAETHWTELSQVEIETAKAAFERAPITRKLWNGRPLSTTSPAGQ